MSDDIVRQCENAGRRAFLNGQAMPSHESEDQPGYVQARRAIMIRGWKEERDAAKKRAQDLR